MLLLNQKYTASLTNIRKIHASLQDTLLRIGMTEAQLDKFLLSASEIFTNALEHSKIPPTRFAVRLVNKNAKLYFTLIDDASVFENITELAENSKNNAENIKDGILPTEGIGLFLSLFEFDDFEYTRTQDQNHYHLTSPSPFINHKPNILIIEDDPSQADLLELLLENDFTITKALSGSEGLELLKNTQTKPNLILCDIVMADGDGVEFCRSIQNQKSLALIPFIFLTGKPTDEIVQKAEDLPVNDVLKKPVEKQALITIINRTLNKAAQDHKIIGDRLDKSVTASLAPALPKIIDPYRIQLKWQEAEAGGGDLALHISGKDIDHIIIIDVMGHGEQAKFFSHSFAGYLKGFIAAQKDTKTPGEILNALSNFLFEDEIGQKTILTALVLSIAKNGDLNIASAGHPPPLLINEDRIQELEIAGPLPGLQINTEYQSHTITLQSNESLILYTDGIMEIGENDEKMQDHKSLLYKALQDTSNIETIWHEIINKTSDLKDDCLIVQIQSD